MTDEGVVCYICPPEVWKHLKNVETAKEVLQWMLERRIETEDDEEFDAVWMTVRILERYERKVKDKRKIIMPKEFWEEGE